MSSHVTHRRGRRVALALVLCLWCWVPAAAEASFFTTYKIASPVRVGNLTLFPVVSKSRVPAGKGFLLLEQGISAGLVTVREVGSNTVRQVQTNSGRQFQTTSVGRVNRVLVTNRSDRELFIMGGEVIVGGKQDRVVQKDVLIPPHSEDVAVPVFCVEKGRWSGKSYSFRSSQQLVDLNLRSKAMFSNQGQVWHEVNRKNALMKTTSNTDTYQGVLRSRRLQKELAPRLARLSAALRRVSGVAGVIVAINGKVKAVDVFYSPALFGRIRDKVVRSYLVEALSLTNARAAKVPLSDAVRFIKLAESAKVRRTLATKGDEKHLFDADNVQGLKLRSRKKKRDVHYNFYTK
ncbi:MAG: hypothetical protein KC609_07270 [Myxococcales bacterium]|nr:hypothetical protein [Myxococcales bacterium]